MLPDELVKMGGSVNVVDAYCTIRAEGEKSPLKEALKREGIHMVTFTRSSTVRNFVEAFRNEEEDFYLWMDRFMVAYIGPVTAKTAEKLGLKVGLLAAKYTIEALTEGTVRYFAQTH